MITNIVQILIENAQKYNNKPAIIHRCRQISYEELVKEMKIIAAYFLQKGIQQGDKVLIFVPMSIDLYKILLAIFYIGATAVFVDAWSDKKRLCQVANLIDCKAFVGIPRAHLLRLFSAEIRKIPLNLIIGIDHLRPDKVIDSKPVIVSLDQAALITFTTGSTGLPKAAKRTYAFLLDQHYALMNHLQTQPSDIDLTTLPMFLLNNLASGITSIIPDYDARYPEKINPCKILKDITKYNISITAGSPVFYEKLAKYSLKNKAYPACLNKIFIGGAPVFPQLARLLNQAFPDATIDIIYGSTEAEPISSIKAADLINNSESIIIKGLPAGNPVNDIKVKVIKIIEGPIQVKDSADFENLTLQPGEAGEICVAGKHVLKEYFNSDAVQKLNKIAVSGTIWHRTGDAGYMDKSGRLYLLGRIKHRFSCENKEYYTLPIENLLLEIPEIEIATVLKAEEKVIVVIELKREYRKQKVILKDQIKLLNIPFDKIMIINKIPRDPRHNSKIDYDRLRTLL